MDFIATLWMPIVFSAIAVFFASSLIWMALPIHKKDYKQFKENEDALLNSLRSIKPEDGMYMFPGCDHKTIKNDPAALARYKAGPWGVVIVRNRPFNFGSMLGMWMVNTLIVSALVAYVAFYALPRGASGASVMRIVGTVAFLAYAGSSMCDSIWKGRPWSQLPGAVFDGVVYAGITGLIFAWRWPGAIAG